MRLFAVEVSRLLARRTTRVLVGLTIIGILLSGFLVLVRGAAPTLGAIHAALIGTTAPFVLLAWVLGATAIGAEWRAGTVATQLTWEPRRLRLLGGKAAAVAMVTFLLHLALQALVAGVLIPTSLARRSGQELDGRWFGEVGGFVLRGAVLAMIAGLIGFALGSIGRNTAVALGVGFVYVVLLEGGLLAAIFPGIERWFLVLNSIVFVGGEPISELTGRSVVGAGVVLAVYGLGSLAVAAALFRTRDVT